MKRSIVIVLCMILSAGFSFAQDLKEVSRLKEVEKYEVAKAILLKKITADPAKAPDLYYYHLGDIYLLTERNDSARYYFMEIIRLYEKSPMGYVGMGKLTYPANTTEGKQNFEKALELSKSDNAFVLSEIGYFYVTTEKRDYTKGIELLEKANKLDFKNAQYMTQLGDAYRLKGKDDASKAMEYYNNALNINPNYAGAYLRKGEIYIAVKNYKGGIEVLQDGMMIDSSYAPLYKSLANVYYYSGKYEKGLEQYKKYLSMVDRNNTNDFRYAVFLVQTKKYEEALTILERLKSKNYDNVVMYRLLAACYYETGKIEEAFSNINTFINKFDNSKLLSFDYEYQGKILFKKGQDSLGAEKIIKAIEVDTSRHDLYSFLGESFYQLKKYTQTEKYLEIKKTLNKASAQDYYTLGKSYYFDAKYELADTNFSSLIQMRPELTLGWLWRARAKVQLDPTSENGLAKPYYEKYIELALPEAEKNKTDLISAYDYLASYYYFIAKDKAKAQENWKKILELDPNNVKAQGGMKLK